MGTYSATSHTADIRILVEGGDLEDVFVTATRAMFELMFGSVGDRALHTRQVAASGDSHSELLWDWLSTVLGWAEADGAVYHHAEVDVGEAAVGVVRGPDSKGLDLNGPSIKAVTLHQLVVEPVHGGWRAEVIFDV